MDFMGIAVRLAHREEERFFELKKIPSDKPCVSEATQCRADLDGS